MFLFQDNIPIETGDVPAIELPENIVEVVEDHREKPTRHRHRHSRRSTSVDSTRSSMVCVIERGIFKVSFHCIIFI